ncbi:aldehyde dehydrogenase (NADP(+)) [Pseudochelatococcus sp. B33]
MTVEDGLLIGHERIVGTNGTIRSIVAETGEPSGITFSGASADQLDRACALAQAAFDDYRARPREERAAFLERIAQNILDIGDELIEVASRETGLPRARLEGERARTVGQLRLFAAVVRDGGYLDLRIDPVQPDRKPLPRVDLRLRHIPVGPVAVFGASNFPLAFSVAGGDTASALAAGCPVIVKAHSAHPATSALVGAAVQAAVRDLDLPEGVFALLFDSGRSIGQGLVADPRIAAVGFTGSRAGGLALAAIAAARPVPIPVYAEMSSINPVILLPGALAARGAEIGHAFVASLTLGVGQFCTNPGLVIAVEGPGLDAFLAAAAEKVREAAPATMLTPGICKAYREGAATFAGHAAVTEVAAAGAQAPLKASARLFRTPASAFLADPSLQEEVFGPAALVVVAADLDEVRRVVDSLAGQLTAALHIVPEDYPAAAGLIPVLEKKVGRILVNGFGTGVEVAPAMVHGGPFPATSDGRTTSVGTLAIARFLRPVSYQDLPDDLLPPELRGEGPDGVPRRFDGKVRL